MAVAQSKQDERRAPREAIDCEARISIAGAVSEALIVNISPHGCMVRCGRTIAIGERMIVEVPTLGDLSGRVIWSLDAHVGLEFGEEIALDPYLNMLSTLGVIPYHPAACDER